MDLNEFQRKADSVADKVGEAGEGPADYIRNNKKTFLIALAVVMLAAVALYNMSL